MEPADQHSQVQRQRAAAALRNLFVADALAMPVHWYYSVSDIDKAFAGGISQLEAAPGFHPSSIMSLHSTRGGGRSSAVRGVSQLEVVGDVILKGRRQHWGQANVHYHQGMLAGENTLNAQCVRVLMRCLVEHDGHYQPASFLNDYIDFMTADSPRHNDTYAESYHRGFFANLQRGLRPEQCAAVTHDTPSIGGLVSTAPLALCLMFKGVNLQTIKEYARIHLGLTHPDLKLARICDDYVGLIERLLFRTAEADIRTIVASVAKQSVGLDLPGLFAKGRDDREVIGRQFSTACYIDGAWPAILYLLYKYYAEPDKALLANTNLGGDNVHRGAVLGVLLGLVHAETTAHWYEGLVERDAIESEIAQLLEFT